MDRIGALAHLGQERPANDDDEADGEQDQHEGGRPGHQRNRREIERPVDEAEILVDLVEHPEGREDRQQAERRHDQQQDRIGEGHQRLSRLRGLRRRPEILGIAGPGDAARRAVVDRELGNMRAGCDRGQILDLRIRADRHVILDDDGRADIGVAADVDRADDEFVALDAGVCELHLRAERRAFADRHEVDGARLEFADDRVGADLSAQRHHIETHDRRGLEPFRMGQRQQPLREPPAVIVRSPQGVTPRLRPSEQQPLAADRDRDRDEVDAHIDAEQRDHLVAERGVGAGDQHVADEDAEPLRRHQREDEGQGDRLREAAPETAHQRHGREGQVARRSAGDLATLEMGGDRAQRPVLVDVLQRDAGETRRLAHHRHEARRDQRMTAQVGEEVGVERNGLGRQRLLRGGEEDRFRLGAWLFLFVDRRGGREFERLQGLTVGLAGGQAGQRVERLITPRHHVWREMLPQFRAKHLGINGRVAFRDEEGDQFIDAVLAAHDDRRLRNAGDRGQPRLDLAEFDAEAADLHLIVDTAAKPDIAVVVEHHGVAGAVEDRIVAVRTKGIGHEFFGRQLVALQIAARDAGAADEQFALDATVEQVQRLVGDITGVVRNRSADRDGAVAQDFGDGGDDGRFGRAIGVEYLAAGLAPACRHGGRAGFAAEDDDAQARHILRQHREKRRHRVENRDAGVVEHVGQPVRLAHHLRRRDEQGRADEIGNPDLLHRQVEGDRRALKDDVVLVDAINLVGGAKVVADVAPGDDDAFRHAGRTGCVDEVGGVIGRRAGRPRVDARAFPDRDFGVDQNRAWHLMAMRLDREIRSGEQGHGFGVAEAYGDALDGRVGVERQPGGAGLGDGDLRDQQFRTARHPQADDGAGLRATGGQTARDRLRHTVDVGIGERPLERGHRGMRAARGDGRRENLGQELVSDQCRRAAAEQDRAAIGGRERFCRHVAAGRCFRIGHRAGRMSSDEPFGKPFSGTGAPAFRRGAFGGAPSMPSTIEGGNAKKSKNA